LRSTPSAADLSAVLVDSRLVIDNLDHFSAALLLRRAGISFALGSIGSSLVMSFCIAAIAELPSYIIAAWSIEHWGRWAIFVGGKPLAMLLLVQRLLAAGSNIAVASVI
jgi:hypothetical protein